MNALQVKRNKQASDKMSEMITRELQASVASNAPVVYKSDTMGYIKGVNNQAGRYLVKDRQTGRIIGQYKFRNAARNKRDKLDLEYGAIRYHITFEG